MPTFLALVTASLSGYLVNVFLKEYSFLLSGIVSFVIWVLVFYFVKRFISRMKP